MSSIGSIGSGSSMMMATQAPKRPDPAEMAAKLFAQLDTSGQGYLDKTDLQAAFSKLSATSSSTTGTTSTDSTSSVDALFTKLDANGDGKVTKQEFSDTLQRAAEQLDQQFMSMRMQDGMQGPGGMPPPPPGGGKDAGFTKEELTNQLQEISSSDSKRSSLISSIVNNFDQADTDGDGKVSMKEAMAYDQTLQNSASSTGTSSSATASSSDTTATDTGSSTAASNDLSAELLRQIMQLMHAYAPANEATKTSSLSITA